MQSQQQRAHARRTHHRVLCAQRGRDQSAPTLHSRPSAPSIAALLLAGWMHNAPELDCIAVLAGLTSVSAAISAVSGWPPGSWMRAGWRSASSLPALFSLWPSQ